MQKYCLIVSNPIIADNAETEDSAADDDGVAFDDPSPELEYLVTQAFEKLSDDKLTLYKSLPTSLRMHKFFTHYLPIIIGIYRAKTVSIGI